MRFLFSISFLLSIISLSADDGYRLWLKYDKISNATALKNYSKKIKSIQITYDNTDIIQSAVHELQVGLRGLLSKEIPIASANHGAIILEKSPKVINNEGYRLTFDGKNIHIQSSSDKGILYGSFALLRAIQTLQPIENMDITDAPKIAIRMLNHWDNVNGTIERGYAG
ncbi:MAG: alpha-glucuronidase family glycosyl hydrolase, partial [Saprospiraceae bacterium]